MCRIGLPVLFSTLALLLVLASAAAAGPPGCDAPPGTAGPVQYCETLPTSQGSQDVTQPASRPLSATLPKPVGSALDEAGVLGEVLMAMPTGTLLSPPHGKPGLANPAREAAAEKAAFDPRLNALTPGPAETSSSAIGAVARSGAKFQMGFNLALVLILVFLAGCSLRTRNLGRRSAG
jgi:hypothetical protein